MANELDKSGSCFGYYLQFLASQVLKGGYCLSGGGSFTTPIPAGNRNALFQADRLIAEAVRRNFDEPAQERSEIQLRVFPSSFLRNSLGGHSPPGTSGSDARISLQRLLSDLLKRNRPLAPD